MIIDLDIYAFSVLIGNCDFSQFTIDPYFTAEPKENADTIKLNIDGSLIKINENYSFQYKQYNGSFDKTQSKISQEKPNCD